MTSDRFEEWRRGVIVRSQHRLADIQRLLIYKKAPRLFDSLDFEDDRAFLDPLLFAWFTNPAREEASKTLTRPLDPPASLSIPETTIEVLLDRHPLFDRFFVDTAGVPVEVEVARTTRAYRQALSRACFLLRSHCPEIMDEVEFVTRYVILYQATAPNSFATLSAHGAAFLNVLEDHDEVFFLEDLAHQCGHVVFNALTFEKDRFLVQDPATPLTSLGGSVDETRTLYSAFHGLSTYTAIVRVLSTCLERQVFNDRQTHEALGRLGFLLRKFQMDLKLLNHPKLFTRTGWRCYRSFSEVFNVALTRHAWTMTSFDYSNQPYVFSYRRFRELNSRRAVPASVHKNSKSQFASRVA